MNALQIKPVMTPANAEEVIPHSTAEEVYPSLGGQLTLVAPDPLWIHRPHRLLYLLRSQLLVQSLIIAAIHSLRRYFELNCRNVVLAVANDAKVEAMNVPLPIAGVKLAPPMNHQN